jgi:hypothetical protein
VFVSGLGFRSVVRRVDDRDAADAEDHTESDDREDPEQLGPCHRTVGLSAARIKPFYNDGRPMRSTVEDRCVQLSRTDAFNCRVR